MVVQRLTIRAATGKLNILPVWRCLATSGVKVLHWHVSADRNAGTESMTVDMVEADPRRTVEIANALSKAPLEMTVTALNLTVASTPGSHRDAGGGDTHTTRRICFEPIARVRS